MTLTPPSLEADPLRPPPADVAEDPILAGYTLREDEPPGEAAGVPIGPDGVTAVLVGVFDLLAQLRGPHWHAEPAEFAVAAPPLARELSKPDTALAAWLARHGDALLIAVGLGAVVVPRAIVEYRVIQLRREQLQQEEATDGRYPHPGGGAAAGSAAGAAERAPDGGAGDGLHRAGEGEAAMGRPTDPGALAAAVGSVVGF